MNKIKYYIQILDEIIETEKLTPARLGILRSIRKFLHNMFVRRSARRSPTLDIIITKDIMQRMIDEPTTKKIIYALQENKGPLSFRQLIIVLNEKITRVNGAIQSLKRTGMIVKIKYAVYNLTNKGKNFVV